MRLLLAFILAITLIGCSTIPQGIAPSAKPLVNEKGETITYDILGQSEGSASHFSLFDFIPFGRTDIDEAIQNALIPLDGDNLINTHYYVTRTWWLIGTSTGITVKGDVIKYTGSKFIKRKVVINKEKVEKLDTNEIKQKVSKQTFKSNNQTTTAGISDFIKDAQHKVTLGSLLSGFAIDYTIRKPINKFLFYSFSLGIKNYSEEVYTNDRDYNWNYTIKETYVPITANIGVNGKTILEKENIPINPYASFGLAYLPPNDFDQIGYNLNFGAVYEIPGLKEIGVGLEYHYLKSLTGSERSFSNLNLSFIYSP